MKSLVLASTSPYRRELLEKLGLPFTFKKPLIDEEKEKDPRWSPLETAEKLATLKAKSLANLGSIVIGGDQLVALDNAILGKPHNFENAVKQLLQMQGRTHELITSVCLFDDLKPSLFTNITRLHMKSLSKAQIETYVQWDQPFDCAGSYKIEKKGITLFEKIETSDFTAIQGLPLIELSEKLKQLGMMTPPERILE